MSYMTLIVIFFFVPAALSAAWVVISVRRGKLRLGEWGAAWIVIALSITGTVYSYPWDWWMVDREAFIYSSAKVSVWLWGIPLEDYLLFLLQTLTVALWTLCMIARHGRPRLEEAGRRPIRPSPLPALLAAGAIVGCLILHHFFGSALYLASMAIWFGPPLLVQLAFGGKTLIREKRLWVASVLPPTVIFWIGDVIALKARIWEINPSASLLKVLDIPVEDPFIFLLGSILVANTMILGGGLPGNERNASRSDLLRASEH